MTLLDDSVGTLADALPTDEQLADLLRDVWSSFLGLDGDALLSDPRPAAMSSWATSSVSVSGAWCGHVVASLSPRLARVVAIAMLASDDVSDDDVSDAVGELANIVGGTVKSLMPGPSALSLPQVLLDGALPHFPGAMRVRRGDLSWDGEPLRLAVWIARCVGRLDGDQDNRQGTTS